MDKNVTLKDIAVKAGFSTITVSKALRNHQDISESTRQYIKQIAAELGYVKNASATGLRTGSTYTLALIIGDITNPFFGILARHVEQHAKKEGYTIIVMNTDEVPEKELDAVKAAISSNVDGVLIVPCQKDDAAIRLMESRNLPYVLIGRHFPECARHAVTIDDFSGGYQATNHLLEQGYTRILMLNADPDLSASTDRLRGYQQAHLDRGIIPDSSLCVYGKSTTGECEETLEKCANLSFDALFAYNDILAFQAITLLEKKGYRVPEDLAVVGFDDVISYVGYLPPITSISVPFDDLAEMSVNQLLAQVKNLPVNPMTTVKVRLNIRGTTPPKKSKADNI